MNLISYIKEIWKYRWYLRYDTLARIKLRNNNTVLGVLWWFLDPLFSMGIYIFVVSIIFKRGGPNYPIYVLLALLPWRWFTTTLNESAASIIGKKGILKDLYFPKIIPVFSTISTNLYNFLLSNLILALFLIIFKIPLTINYLYFPFIVFVQLIFTIGISFILSHYTIIFEDIKILTKHALLIWFYISPAIYPVKLIPEKILPYIVLNPFYVFFNSYRQIIMYNQAPNLSVLFVLLTFSILLTIVGLRLLAKNDGRYAKIL